jgi:hypothetical protein
LGEICIYLCTERLFFCHILANVQYLPHVAHVVHLVFRRISYSASALTNDLTVENVQYERRYLTLNCRLRTREVVSFYIFALFCTTRADCKR